MDRSRGWGHGQEQRVGSWTGAEGGVMDRSRGWGHGQEQRVGSWTGAEGGVMDRSRGWGHGQEQRVGSWTGAEGGVKRPIQHKAKHGQEQRVRSRGPYSTRQSMDRSRGWGQEAHTAQGKAWTGAEGGVKRPIQHKAKHGQEQRVGSRGLYSTRQSRVLYCASIPHTKCFVAHTVYACYN